MSYFVPSVITGMAAGGAFVGAAAWNRPWYGLFSGTLYGVIAVALNHFFGMKVTALYLAGLTIFALGQIGLNFLTRGKENPLSSTSLVKVFQEERKKIAAETLQCIEQGYYINPQGEKIPLQSGEVLYQKSLAHSDISEAFWTRTRYMTQLSVVKRHYIDVAQEEAQSGANVALVNLASPLHPGGGFEEGMKGEEQQLCFRSELAGFMKEVLNKFQQGHRDYFPLNNHHDRKSGESLQHGKVVYTPQVQFFRSHTTDHYAFLEKPFTVAVISSAALANPPLSLFPSGITDYLNENDRQYVRTAIRAQLYAAYLHQHDTIIIGYDDFKNPPHAVAMLYREIINWSFAVSFKKIIFAMDEPLREAHNPDGNFGPFYRVFMSS